VLTLQLHISPVRRPSKAVVLCLSATLGLTGKDEPSVADVRLILRREIACTWLHVTAANSPWSLR